MLMKRCIIAKNGKIYCTIKHTIGGALNMSKLSQKTKDLLETLAIILIVLVINIFIIGNARVYGISMYPTLNNGSHNDRVIVEKYKRFSKNYNRGDIIILKSHDKNDANYIKRIVGMPNEVVEIKDGKVYINGNILNENYIPSDVNTKPEMKVNVPEGYVFVLGDNRDHSSDSRELGVIAFDDIVGKASYKFNILDLSFEKLK